MQIHDFPTIAAAGVPAFTKAFKFGHDSGFVFGRRVLPNAVRRACLNLKALAISKKRTSLGLEPGQPLRYNESELIKALGNAHFFFRRKIGLFSLRAISQSCIIHQYFIFCHFPLTFKTTALRIVSNSL